MIGDFEIWLSKNKKKTKITYKNTMYSLSDLPHQYPSLYHHSMRWFDFVQCKKSFFFCSKRTLQWKRENQFRNKEPFYWTLQMPNFLKRERGNTHKRNSKKSSMVCNKKKNQIELFFVVFYFNWNRPSRWLTYLKT